MEYNFCTVKFILLYTEFLHIVSWSFDRHVQGFNNHTNQTVEIFCHPKLFLHAVCLSVANPSPYISRKHLSP